MARSPSPASAGSSPKLRKSTKSFRPPKTSLRFRYLKPERTFATSAPVEAPRTNPAVAGRSSEPYDGETLGRPALPTRHVRAKAQVTPLDAIVPLQSVDNF